MKIPHIIPPGVSGLPFLSLLVMLFGCTTPSIIVTTQQQLGDQSFNRYNYREAISYYNNMLDASAKLGIYRNLTMEADVHRKIANGYEMLGQYGMALEHVGSALFLDSTENNALNIIEDYRQLGKIHVYQGNNHRAITYLEKSLSLSEGMDRSLKTENRISISDNYLVLGQLYATMGRFRESTIYTGQALDGFISAGDKRGEMESLLTMGSIYINLGDLDFAQTLIRKSEGIAIDLDLSTARHLYNLGRISSTLGYYEDALRQQERALEQAKKYSIEAQKIWFTVRLGDIYHEIGDNEKSIEYYMDALSQGDTVNLNAQNIEASLNLRLGELTGAMEYFTREGSVVGAGISYLRIAEIAFLESNIIEAEQALSEGEKYFSEAGNMIGMANTMLLQAKINILKNNYVSALKYLNDAAQTGDFPEILWQSWYQKGLIYEKQGKIPEAQEAYREAIKVIERVRGNLTIEEFKSTYIDNKIEVYDRLINILLDYNQSEEALEVSERAKARAFFELLANKKIDFRKNDGDSLVLLEQNKRFEIQQLYKQIQKINSGEAIYGESRQVNQRQLQNDLANSQEQYEEILRSIKLYNPAYAEIISMEPAGLNELRSTIDNKTKVISYWISKKAVHYWLIDNSTLSHKTVPLELNLLNRLIEDTRRYISSNSVDKANEGLSKLYSYLIEPVESELENFNNLVIIPNGGIHFIPFQALLCGNNEYLINKFNITYSPSINVHIYCQEKAIRPGNRLLGAALSGVSVGNNIGLPGTEDELKKIQVIFPDNKSVFGENSSETFIKNNSGDYNYIHLATHGFFNFNQPLYSFLLFPPNEDDDGRLTVHEVFELDLDARLVTLSACETGLGDIDNGDELVGLNRAFIYAGSSAVIVSLWRVSDYETSLLMSNFYSYLKDHSMTESLSLAQKDVMALSPNPFYWAPFILIGNGGD